MPRRYATFVDDNGRECTVCHKYKTRDNYSYWGIARTWKISRCKDCFNAFVKWKLSDLDHKVNQIWKQKDVEMLWVSKNERS